MDMRVNYASQNELEEAKLTDQTEQSAEVYMLNTRVAFVPDAPPMPNALLQGGGPRQLSSIEFLRHERFTPDELARAPKELKFPTAERRNLGDFAHNSNALILSRRAADVLERLESGRHQILPLQIESSKRYRERLEHMQFVLVNVCQKVQAVDVEKSVLEPVVFDWPPYPKHTSYHISVKTDDQMPRVTVIRSKAQSLHLWAGDQRILEMQLFVSKALKDAWTAAGCGPMTYLPCTTI